MYKKNAINGPECGMIGDIELFVPDKKRAYDISEFFYIHYTVAELRDLVAVLYPLVKKRKIVGEGAGTSVEVIVDNINAKPTSANKDVLVDFIAIFLGDLRNFGQYLESLPGNVQLLWNYLIRNKTISYSTLKKITGEEWIKSTDIYSSWSKSLIKSPFLAWFVVEMGEPSWYDSQTHRYISEIYISMPDFLFNWFIPFFYEKTDFVLTELPELPAETEQLKVFNAESSIFTELTILDGLEKQGGLEINEKWKLSAACLKKLSAQVNLSEFFPQESDRSLNTLRANLMFSTFAFFWTVKKRNIGQPEKELRDIFSEMILNYPVILYPILLPYTSGLRSSEFRNQLGLQYLKMVISEITLSDSQQWLLASQFILHCRFYNIPFSPFNRFSLEKMKLKDKLSGDFIYKDGWYIDLDEVFIKSFIFLLASFGLLEIAYDACPSSFSSPFHALRYFRLTALGAYVFNITNTYELPKAKEEGPFFDLDARNLIVRSLGENNPYETLLQDVAIPIGQHRYKLTHASFLNNCKTNEDVVNKIEFFKRFISAELPEIWSEFFDSLMKRCRPLTSISADKYLVYQLDAGNEELLRLVSTDPVIRENTVRAEGYLLLVKKDSLKQVVARLKYSGYLL
ncbi:hypothetical protein [uncultured Parabacteroides sp.]|uniref:hypothetical protein n=4 Tax=uncultured Parabacteroides sp. TaxID=512312 RepID=UPI002658483D|nr:hypothetical protein [uncultured Parabacteroides sp.]